MAQIAGTSHEDQCAFMVISRSYLVRMRNISDEYCSKNQDTHFMFNAISFLDHSVYEIMWKNSVELDRLQMPKDTNTHSEYIIFIAFPLEQWLHERAFRLPCTCIFL